MEHPPQNEQKRTVKDSQPQSSSASTTREIALAHLELDRHNARFGLDDQQQRDQADVLDHIVETFGVDDVLSSIAINGYMSPEPVVCREDSDGRLTVVEGNRRLAACLIIAGDPRAVRQRKRTEQYQKIWKEHGSKTIDPLPAIVFDASEESSELLSYLGVRHIAAAQPWDSHAKATWVARVIENQKLSLGAVALMIGDNHQTIRRLLDGYYLMEQLIEEDVFVPANSIRRGRGSVTAYPFSWIYTALDYNSTKRFLGLDPARPPRKRPVERVRLADAGLFVHAMFGDKGRGRNAAIDDSRQIGKLAKMLDNPNSVELLRSGKTVEEIERATKPIEQKLRDGLTTVRSIQGEMVSSLSEEPIDGPAAEALASTAKINSRTAADIAKRLQAATLGIEDV